MILEQLREETKAAHQSLEKKLIPFIKKISSTEQYARLLNMFHAYYNAIEQSIYRYIDTTDLSDINERRKSTSLTDDLKIIGEEESSEIVSSQPQIINKYQAMGALYVLEGSTLGGKIIAQIIAKNIPSLPIGALSFFQAYGDSTPEKWQLFLTTLNSFTDQAAEIEDIIAGANQTFSSLEEWVDKQLYQNS